MTQVLKHTVSCIVKNRAGVLARIAGSFAEKGINIVSLAVGEMEEEATSRMTIVVRSDESLLSAVVGHLRELPDVIDVEDLDKGELIEREVMLVRVRAEGEDIAKIMQLVEIFRATVAGMGKGSLVIEMTGPESRVDALANLLRPFGIIELARTGRVAIEHVEQADAG
jgi:acetolactate synthase I/III small subunit